MHFTQNNGDNYKSGNKEEVLLFLYCHIVTIFFLFLLEIISILFLYRNNLSKNIKVQNH